MGYEIKLLNTDDAQTLSACFAVFTHLRPHLTEAMFIERVRMQTAQGYKIAYIESGGTIAAGAGFRIANFLAWGKVLYIDDLITHPDKKRVGLGGALLDWLIDQGRQLKCDEVHLDTGHQRHDAHRMYLNKGFILSSHHMSLKLR